MAEETNTEQARRDAEYDNADPEAMHDRDGHVELPDRRTHESTTTGVGCGWLVLDTLLMLALLVAVIL